jgi:hypothetical protein
VAQSVTMARAALIQNGQGSAQSNGQARRARAESVSMRKTKKGTEGMEGARGDEWTKCGGRDQLAGPTAEKRPGMA